MFVSKDDKRPLKIMISKRVLLRQRRHDTIIEMEIMQARFGKIFFAKDCTFLLSHLRNVRRRCDALVGVLHFTNMNQIPSYFFISETLPQRRPGADTLRRRSLFALCQRHPLLQQPRDHVRRPAGVLCLKVPQAEQEGILLRVSQAAGKQFDRQKNNK